MPTPTDRARQAAGMNPQQRNGAPSTEIAVAVDKRIAETRLMRDPFADAVATGLSPDTLIRDAITAVRNVPQLAETSKDSFFGALMTAAQLGLRPNVGSLGHGWVLPRWNGRASRLEAQWQLGYQGMVELAYRSGLVAKITAHTIYQGERHRIAWGTEDVLIHEPQQDHRERGERLWHYAVVWLTTSGVLWNAITDADAQFIRDHYGPRNRNNQLVGPWVAGEQEYETMARKSALRGLWRWMPKTPTLALALDTDGVTREGMAADPALDTDEPAREPVTLTRTDQPPTDPAPPEPEPEAEPSQPAAVPIPETWQGPRTHQTYQRIADTNARAAYMGRIRDKFMPQGGEQAVAGAIESVVGELVPLHFLTTAQLRRVAEFEWDARG